MAGGLNVKMEFLVKLFNKICVVLPLGISAVLALGFWMGLLDNVLPSYDYANDPMNYKVCSLIILFVLVLICCLIIYVFKRYINRVKNQVAKHCISAGVLFLFAFGIRFLLVYIFRENIIPFSDFRRVWEIAHGQMEGNIDYYSLFPAYLNFAVFEQELIALTGDVYMHLIYLNVILSALTIMLIYFIAWFITKDDTISLLTGLILTLMPSNIVYVAVGTPEFITIFFNTLGVLFLILLMQTNKSTRPYFRYPYALLSGISLGIGTSYKSFAVIILFAFFLAFSFERISLMRKEHWKRVRYLLIELFLTLGLLVVSYSSVKSVILTHTENVLHLEADTSASFPHYFLIGLNTEGEGQISLGTISRLYYKEYLSNGLDVEAAKEYAFEVLKEDWSTNKDRIVPLFIKKNIRAWQNDIVPAKFWNYNVGLIADSPVEKMIYEFSAEKLPTIMQLYYFLTMLFATMGLLFVMRNKEINYSMEFCLLIIFGYFCLLMLSEAQSRYKCLIMPYVCVISAIGICKIVRKINFRRFKK